ncbi:MAG TPA: hypothetical protein VIK04_03850 [Solirubrobacteraceae bacterium]
MRRVAPGLAVMAGLGVSGCALTLGRGASSPRRPPAPAAASRFTTAPVTASRTTTTPVTASRTTTQSPLAVAQRTHEYPTPAPHQTVPGGWRSPVQAVSVFADTYVNWTAATVSVRLRALAEVSVGQARSAMSLAAGETARDYELRRGGIANSGTVVAVAAVRGAANEYAVVTRELTTATNTSAYRGLAPTWHVSLATVTRVTGGLWVLSGWQPEG